MKDTPAFYAKHRIQKKYNSPEKPYYRYLWRMSRTFHLDHHLQVALQPVYESVLDMRHFGKHHPYMKEVTILNSTPEFTEYQIKEMVWIFGFIPQWPSYTAKVFEKEKLKHIQYTSAVKGGVDLKIDFLFSPLSPQSTHINERIETSGNYFFCSILLSAIRKSHRALFTRLNGEFAP